MKLVIRSRSEKSSVFITELEALVRDHFLDESIEYTINDVPYVLQRSAIGAFTFPGTLTMEGMDLTLAFELPQVPNTGENPSDRGGPSDVAPSSPQRPPGSGDTILS